jgi:phosphoglycerate dehydrogenase-like enzyme
MFSQEKTPVLIVSHRHLVYKELLESVSDRFEITSMDRRDPIPFESHPAEILLCWKIQDDLLRRLPKLRWISALSAGVDHLLTYGDALKNIILTRAMGTMGNFLAEYAIQHSLNHLKNLQSVHAQQSENKWRFVKSELLSMQTVAVYGYGSLGSQVGAAFHALGASVIGVKREVSRQDQEQYSYCQRLYDYSSFSEVVPQADIHILLMPDTTETKNLFSKEVFIQMKDSSLLINLGRGSLIDDQALLESLDAGKPAFAVLDVFREEPLPEDHPFWNHYKVLVTPHCGGPSEEESMIDEFLQQLQLIESGHEPLRQVLPGSAY